MDLLLLARVVIEENPQSGHLLVFFLGGAVACRLYSLVLSCRAAGLNPELYLEAVLCAVATTPATETATLTPLAWAEQHPEHRLPPAN